MARDLTRIGERARRLREERFTSIYHYVTDLDHLRACYANLRADSAPGVDGVGKEEYGANLEREAEEPYVGKLLVVDSITGENVSNLIFARRFGELESFLVICPLK